MSKTKSRLKKTAGVMAVAVALVGGWEGVRTVAYKDIVGVPTVCFGETRGVKMGDRYSLQECKVMLGDALVEFEAGMRKCLNSPDTIPDKPYVAFLSLSYNIGINGFCKSSIARYANAGDLKAACNAIPLYNKAGGKVVRGLVNRRADEQRICLEGLSAKPIQQPVETMPEAVAVPAASPKASGMIWAVVGLLAAGAAIFFLVRRKKGRP